MLTRRVRCTKCQTPLATDLYNTGLFESCPGCQAQTQVEVFHALLEPPRVGAAAELVSLESEAGCFFHPAKKAVVPCDACGRFLCSVCEIEFAGQHLCPSCLESGRKKGNLRQLENRRVLYDSLALALAVYPLLIFYLTFITAPMVFYIAIRHWKSPSSVIPRNKWRFVLALIIAGAQITGWTLLMLRLFA